LTTGQLQNRVNYLFIFVYYLTWSLPTVVLSPPMSDSPYNKDNIWKLEEIEPNW